MCKIRFYSSLEVKHFHHNRSVLIFLFLCSRCTAIPSRREGIDEPETCSRRPRHGAASASRLLCHTMSSYTSEPNPYFDSSLYKTSPEWTIFTLVLRFCRVRYGNQSCETNFNDSCPCKLRRFMLAWRGRSLKQLQDQATLELLQSSLVDSLFDRTNVCPYQWSLQWPNSLKKEPSH